MQAVQALGEINRIPRSLVFFALTAAVYLLQVLPFPGIFLMFALAAFWSVVLVNLGFVALAVEAGLGKVSKLWLIAPIAWFGGYFLFAVESHRTLDAIDAEFKAFNAGKRIAFDANAHALVLENTNSGEQTLQGYGLPAYRLPVVYTVDQEARRLASQAAGNRRSMEYERKPIAAHMAHRLGATGVCTTLAASYRSAGIYPTYPVSDRRSTGNQVCQYSMPEDPVLPPVRVATKTVSRKTFVLPYKVTTVTVTAADGTATELKAGYGAPYPYFPIPVMGCFLNSGGPSWVCHAGFMQGSYRGLGAEGTYGAATEKVLAAALGLEAVPASDRYDEIEAYGAPTLAAVAAKIEARSLDAVDQVIAEPRLRITGFDVRGLSDQPALFASRAPAMVAAMEASLAAGKGNSETARVLQGLLAVLPDADFVRIGKPLVDAIERTKPKATRTGTSVLPEIEGRLLTRFGDLGALSLPILEPRVLGSNGSVPSETVLGLCRVGRAAAYLAPRLVELWPSQRWGNTGHKAVFVTLLRMGRKDIVQPIVEQMQAENATRSVFTQQRLEDYTYWLETVSPDSPPAVCTTNVPPRPRAKPIR